MMVNNGTVHNSVGKTVRDLRFQTIFLGLEILGFYFFYKEQNSCPFFHVMNDIIVPCLRRGLYPTNINQKLGLHIL